MKNLYYSTIKYYRLNGKFVLLKLNTEHAGYFSNDRYAQKL